MARPKYSEELVSDRVDEIVSAAMSVLKSGGGVDAVTLRNTAKVMNCSYTALYRYFARKQDLIIALRTRAFRWMESELSAVHLSGGDALSSLRAIFETYIRVGVERPDLYELMFFEVHDEADSAYYVELERAKTAALDVCVEAVRAFERL